MKRIRKLIAFLLGAVILVAVQYFNVNVVGLDGLGLNLVVLGLTGLGIYQVPNDN